MEEAFKKYYQELKYFAYSFLKVWQDAEDIAIDCIIKVCSKEYNKSELRIILFTSVKNKCLDILRRRKSKLNQQQYFDEKFYEELDVELFAVKVEFFKQINEAIETLPLKEKEIFKKIFFEHKDTTKIAYETNVTIETIRSTKRHAIQHIKKYLSKYKLYNEIKN